LYECNYSPKGKPNFPYQFAPEDEACCGILKQTAMGNTFLKEFAMAAIPALGLGQDDVTDFLSLSFSSTDLVAHLFGPDSREVEDTYIRLDRDLEELLNFLDQQIGKGQVLVFLTADHGGAPNPEYAKQHGSKGGWLNVKQIEAKLKEQLGDKSGTDSLLYRVQGHNVYLNRELAGKRKLDLDSLNDVIARTLEGMEGIEGSYTRKDIVNQKHGSMGFEMLKNGYYPDRSGDVLFLMQYGYMKAPESESWRMNKGTSHGTHYDYDTHVPLIFWGWKVKNGSTEEKVVIPDIAPTVCQRLNISAPANTTGKSRQF
jgi:predicted AlkP superfamily pyrophosphatase or phosphodiesterase